jgi:hypothetical protein
LAGSGYPANYDGTGVQAATYTGGGLREDLLDLVTIIDPWDTPFFTSAPKSQARNVLHEWLTDSLTATSVAGADEGADFSAAALVARTRLNNICQIFRKDMAVTDTMRSVNPAGIRDEYEYQIMKGLREIVRNAESTFWRVANTAAVTAIASARQLASFRSFAINTSAINGAITTADVINLHQQIYQTGGNPDTLYLSPGAKKAFTLAVAANSTVNFRNIAATDRKLIANIDVFESDFGLLAVVPDRFIPQGSTTAAGNCSWLVERSKARIAFLRPLKHVPIAKGGDSTRGIVLTEMTLEVLHPSAHGALTGITST